MKREWRWAGLVAALVLAAFTPGAFAEEAHVYVAAHASYPELSGDGLTAGTGVTAYDVEETLDAGGSDLHLGLDIFGRFGRHRLVAGFSQGEHEGENSLSQAFGFDGQLVTSGDFDSKIDLSRRKLLYGFAFVNSGMVDFGVLVGSEGYDLSTKLSQFGSSREVQIDSPAPAIGLNFGVRPPVVPLRLYGEVVYSSLEISDVDTTLTDATVSLDLYIIPVLKLFGFQAGYRYYDLEAEDKAQGAKFNYKFQGPFAGVVLRF